ncbi:unnamed protein product [Brachionus calyciflorus]|uniref:Uncharacterized protein n=1 Tax=Brachionus calyciflorus TaxID=104777 RepID=A0A814CJA3_9BILA|nr:unnamed protein product [Brachionus calyciflorus]
MYEENFEKVKQDLLKAQYAPFAKWGLDKKIIAIVTDNAYNVVNAVHFWDNISIRCSVHILQSAIQDAFENQQKLEEILAKCRSKVGHYKHQFILIPMVIALKTFHFVGLNQV